MHALDGGAPHDFGPALGVGDVHPKEKLHYQVKNAAGKAPLAGLHLVQHRARNPARADHAIGFPGMAHQVQKRPRFRRPVRIDVADQIGPRRQPESLDERAALADGGRVIDRADFGVVRGNPLHDGHRIVTAVVEDHHELKFPVIIPPEELRVSGQNGADPALLIVRRYQQ